VDTTDRIHRMTQRLGFVLLPNMGVEKTNRWHLFEKSKLEGSFNCHTDLGRQRSGRHEFETCVSISVNWMTI
jgi:hypothetical protein